MQVKVVNSNFTGNGGQCFGAILGIYLSEAAHNSLTFAGCIFSNNSQVLSIFTHQSGRYVGSTVTLYMKYFGNYSIGNDCLVVADSEFIEGDESFVTSLVSLTQFPGRF